MISDKREVIDVKENSNFSTFFALFGTVSFVVAVALAYLSYGTYQNAFTLSKSQFVCTKIEQLGKNMDDVTCVQYTSQKFYKEAVVLNRTAMNQ
jgi:hypothetical protein